MRVLCVCMGVFVFVFFFMLLCFHSTLNLTLSLSLSPLPSLLWYSSLNTQIESPEIVLIGAQGHGKSSVLEAFLGFPINMVGNGGCTKRPVIFNLNNNVDYEQPKVILKRDSILTDFDQDVVVKLKDLPAQLKKRNVATEGPVFVQFEYKHALNLQLIDMPGLIEENQGDLMADEIRMAVEEWITPPHRIILAVEQCQSADKLRLHQLIKPFDPDFARTVFALTHFNDHVRGFTSARDLNRFLQQNTHQLQRFFVTLPSLAVRSRFTDVRPFQEKLWQYVQRDLDDLEKLSYNKTFVDRVGIVALRKHLLHLTWYRYKALIPKILAQLRAKRAQTKRDIDKVSSELEGLDSSRLRALASKYAVDFLQIIEQLLSGTSEGNVSVHGQTLADEKADHGDAEWYTASGSTVAVEAGSDQWDIPYWANRLYGGQQFERLLREFTAVVGHAEFPMPSMDDVATAAGMGNLSNAPDHAWAATDLAQQKVREVLNPLIEQLASRASHLFKRLVSIAQRIMESRQQAKEGGQVSNVDDITQYTYFTYHVQNLYDEFVDQVAKQAQDKCMDEFYSPRTIYWEITKLEQRTPDSSGGDDGSEVIRMAEDIFKDVRDRISSNVVLKFYNFFLVPMQTDLWKVVQGDITHLSDDQLEQKFSLQTTIQNLENDRNNLEDVLVELDDQELLFSKAAKEFGQL
jgi:Dynamin family